MMVVPSPFSFLSAFTSLPCSSCDRKSFRPTPVTDNRSSRMLSQKRERLAGALAGPLIQDPKDANKVEGFRLQEAQGHLV